MTAKENQSLIGSEHFRKDYQGASLDERLFAADPVVQFDEWFAEAVAAGVVEPNAMSIATVGEGGLPSVRMVLLKGTDRRGFRFFTNGRSRKGHEIDLNPNVALCFHWQQPERQVRVCGTASRCEHAETEAYFSSRPRGAQVAAYASHQSEPLFSQSFLEDRMAEVDAEFSEGGFSQGGRPIPVPAGWTGYIVRPTEVEFWQGRRNRAHERLKYRLDVAGAWTVERLYP